MRAGVEPGAPRLAAGDPQPGQEGDREQHAVGVESERADCPARAGRTRAAVKRRGYIVTRSSRRLVGRVMLRTAGGSASGERRMSRTSRTTPMLMAESATLKAGQWCWRQ